MKNFVDLVNIHAPGKTESFVNCAKFFSLFSHKKIDYYKTMKLLEGIFFSTLYVNNIPNVLFFPT